jgi:hypothetical protein
MIIQKDIPDDCVKFFPVTQIGRKWKLNFSS